MTNNNSVLLVMIPIIVGNEYANEIKSRVQYSYPCHVYPYGIQVNLKVSLPHALVPHVYLECQRTMVPVTEKKSSLPAILLFILYVGSLGKDTNLLISTERCIKSSNPDVLGIILHIYNYVPATISLPS